MGLKKNFETAVVNEPSVFEPPKFYCILLLKKKFEFTEVRLYEDKEPFYLNKCFLYWYNFISTYTLPLPSEQSGMWEGKQGWQHLGKTSLKLTKEPFLHKLPALFIIILHLFIQYFQIK